MPSIAGSLHARSRPVPWSLLVGVVFVAAACSGGDESASGEVATLDVATLADTDGAADAATISDDEGEALDPDEAALAFSECMRDEGIDFPDLTIDADGNLSLRAAFQGFDRGDEDFAAASEACISLLGETAFGNNQRQDLESPEIEDALLEFTDCVRDAGYDVGDLTLGGPGQGQGQGQAAGGAQNADAADADGETTITDGNEAEADAEAGEDGDGEGQGRRQQGFGNRNARFAAGLDLDYEDPDVMAAIDGCAPIVDEAFADAGVGQGANGGGNEAETPEG